MLHMLDVQWLVVTDDKFGNHHNNNSDQELLVHKNHQVYLLRTGDPNRL